MTVRAMLGLAKRGENRSVMRKTLRLVVSGRRTNKQATEVLIHDLSRDGLLIESDEPIRIGETITVELPGGGSRQVVAVWSSTHFYGCRFARPLSRAAVSAALLKALPATDKSTIEDPKTAPPTEFAANLAARREELGLSIEQLARRLRVSRQAIWYWESGRRVPRRSLAERVARELGIGEHEIAPSRERGKGARSTLLTCRELIATQCGVGVESVKITVEL